MSEKKSAHLRCTGGEKFFCIVIDGEEDETPRCRKVVLTRRFDRDVRDHLLRVMHCVLRKVRREGAEYITIDPGLEHELNIQQMGFDTQSQTLISV